MGPPIDIDSIETGEVTEETLVMASRFGFFVRAEDGEHYFVPKDAQKAYDRGPNTIADAAALNALLKSGTSEWYKYCHPDHVLPVAVDGDALNFTRFRFEKNADGDEGITDAKVSKTMHLVGINECMLIQFPTRMYEQFGKFKGDLSAAALSAKVESHKELRLKALDWVPSFCKTPCLDYKALGWLPVSDIQGAIKALKIAFLKQKLKQGAKFDEELEKKSLAEGVARLVYVSENVARYKDALPGNLCNGMVGIPVEEEPVAEGVPVDQRAGDAPPGAPSCAPSTALVAAPKFAKHEPFTEELLGDKEFEYPVGRANYQVAKNFIKHRPTRINVISATELAALKDNRTPATWEQYMHPCAVGRMKGYRVVEDGADRESASNLFMMFLVIDEAGRAMDAMTNKMFVVGPTVYGPIIKKLNDQFEAGAFASDFTLETPEGKAVKANVLDFVEKYGLQAKLDPKINAWGDGPWTKLAGAYTSPLPKIDKPPRGAKSTSTDGAAGSGANGKNKRPHEQSAQLETSEVCAGAYEQHIDGPGGQNYFKYMKIIDVGDKYSTFFDKETGKLTVTVFGNAAADMATD